MRLGLIFNHEKWGLYDPEIILDNHLSSATFLTITATSMLFWHKKIRNILRLLAYSRFEQIIPKFNILPETTETISAARSVLFVSVVSRGSAVVVTGPHVDASSPGGSVCNDFCPPRSEQRTATKPNLSRGKARLSSRDDKPGAIPKQIVQLPHCEALRGIRLGAGNRDSTDPRCYTGKRRWKRGTSNALINADGADGQSSSCSSCIQNFNVTINSTKRKKKKESNTISVFFCFQALGWAALKSHPHFY